jgi:hypothetical protein
MTTRKESTQTRKVKSVGAKRTAKEGSAKAKPVGARKKTSKETSSSRATVKKSAEKSGVRQLSAPALMASQAVAAQSHFPGFDTGSYPGDAVMRAWFGKPFVFTGFYLEAPCHNATKFKPFMGHLQTLKEIGWGLVVVYVGRQAAGCGANKLTREQGLIDAADAISKAKSEGISQGATVFLDVELMDSISTKMLQYMRGWIAGVLQDKSYKPGIYAHFRNANALMTAGREEFAEQGQPDGAPAFWVVRVPGGSKFDVSKSSPQDLNALSPTPISFANVWQGNIDIKSETHGGMKFGPVDENVANSANPSNA